MTIQDSPAASRPEYGVLVEENVYVPARDGVGLAIDIYRPDAPGKFPALLALSPYGKSLQTFETPPQPFGKSCFEASIESGDPYFYAPRGYVYVIGDLRGTGDSEGEYEGSSPSTKARTGPTSSSGWPSSRGATATSGWQASATSRPCNLHVAAGAARSSQVHRPVGDLRRRSLQPR